MSNELQWATKVASILTSAQAEFERDVSKLEYNWKVQRSAQSILAMPEKFQKDEFNKLEFWFGLDVHRAMNNKFDGTPMAIKSINEERRHGWSTD